MARDRIEPLVRTTLVLAVLAFISGCNDQRAEKDARPVTPEAASEGTPQSRVAKQAPPGGSESAPRVRRRVIAKHPAGDVTIGGRKYRTIRLKNGAVSILPPRPTRTTVPPERGCKAQTSESEGAAQIRLLPPAPGLSAAWTEDRVTVSYSFRGASRDCRPTALEVTVDENDDSLPGISRVVRLHGLHGSVSVGVPEILGRADVVRASARTGEGLRSDAVAVLIR